MDWGFRSSTDSRLLHFTHVRMFALGLVYLILISALYPLEARLHRGKIKVPLGERGHCCHLQTETWLEPFYGWGAREEVRFTFQFQCLPYLASHVPLEQNLFVATQDANGAVSMVGHQESSGAITLPAAYTDHDAQYPCLLHSILHHHFNIRSWFMKVMCLH